MFRARRVLFARLKREAVEQGMTVVERGQLGQRFYLIGSGQLEAVLENGDTVILRTGDYFGDENLSGDKMEIRSRRDNVLFYIAMVRTVLSGDIAIIDQILILRRFFYAIEVEIKH